MPRNRMIKTDFWADEKIGKLSIPGYVEQHHPT